MFMSFFLMNNETIAAMINCNHPVSLQFFATYKGLSNKDESMWKKKRQAVLTAY